jgi:hypothetical protein
LIIGEIRPVQLHVLTYLHYANTLLKGSHNLWQFPIESFQQFLLPAITDSHPKQFARIAGPIREVKKVFVLANNNPVGGCRVIPNRDVEFLV